MLRALRIPVLVLAAASAPLHAALNVQITSGASSGGFFFNRVWTPTASPSRINVADLLAQLNAGNVLVTTGTTGSEAGNITVSSAVALDQLTTTTARILTLRAADDVIVNAAIAQTGGGTPNNVSLVFEAHDKAGAVSVAANLDSAGGAQTFSGAGFTLAAGHTLQTGGNTFSIDCGGVLSLGASSIVTSGGGASIFAGGTGSVAADIVTSGGPLSVVSGGTLTVASGADLDATGGAGLGLVTARSDFGSLDFTGRLFGGNVLHVMRGATGVLFQGGSQVNVSRLDVDATGAGNIEIRNLSNLSLTHSASFDTQNGDILLVAGANFTSSVSSGLTLHARGAAGDVSIARSILLDDAGASLTITAQAIVAATASLTTTNGALVLTGRDISLSSPVATQGGGFSASAPTGPLTFAAAAALTTGGGTVQLSAGDLGLSSTIVTSGGSLAATASGKGSVANDITTAGGNVTITCAGDLTVTPGSQIDVRGGAGLGAINARSTGGTFELHAGIAGGSTTQVLAGHTGLILKAGFSAHALDLDVTGTGDLTLQTGTTLTVATSATIDTANGDVLLDGTTSFGASGGTTTLTARGLTGDVAVNAPLACGAAGITLRADNDVVVGAAITASGADLTIRSDLNNGGSGRISTLVPLHSAGGDIALQGVSLATSGAITTSGGVFSLIVGGGSLTHDIVTSGGNLTVQAAGNVSTAAGADLDASGGAGLGAVSVLSTSGKVTVGGTLRSGGALLVSGAAGVVFDGDILGAGDVNVACVTGNIALNATASLVNSGLLMAFEAANSTITTAAGAVLSPGASSLLRLRVRGNANDLAVNLPLSTGGGGLELFSDRRLDLNAAVGSSGPISLRADANADGSGDLSVLAPVTGATRSVSLRGAGVTVLAAVDTTTGEIAIQPGPGNGATIAAALRGPSRLVDGTTLFTVGGISGDALTLASGAELAFDNASRAIFPSAVTLQGPSAETHVRLGGTAAGQFNRIVSSGSFTAGGRLNVGLQTGFTPAPGMSFDLFDFTGFAGGFTSYELPPLGANIVWDTSQLGVTGALRVVTPLELWRQQHFGTTLDAGDAANGADPDRDGVVNALEYALGTPPLSGGGHGLPTVGRVSVGGADYLTLTVSRPVSVTDASYRFRSGSTVQASNLGSLYSSSGDIPSNAFTTQVSRLPAGDRELITVRDNTPVAAGSGRFMRLEVTLP
jgi:hypothetical protein